VEALSRHHAIRSRSTEMRHVVTACCTSTTREPGPATTSGGAAHFDNLDSTGLAALIEARFIDPYEQQDLAPTTWQIFQFLCHHPQVRAMGYVISIDRPDYRTSLETVYANEIDTDLRTDAEKFCVDADEVTTDGQLECFWD
jgi:hypothetical protein